MTREGSAESGIRDVLAAGGEVGRDTLAVDWAAHALGPPEEWPRSLQTVVQVVLTSRFAMWMAWGPELTFFCNDAYRRDTLGKKYPWALGRSAREVWAEIWPDIGPRIETVMRTGVATWDEALQLFLERSGYAEETYHTFSYSPLTDDDGRIAGMLCVVSEDTERVIGERRLATLRDLGSVRLDADRGRGARDRVPAPGRQRARRAVRAHLPLRRGRDAGAARRDRDRAGPSRRARHGLAGRRRAGRARAAATCRPAPGRSRRSPRSCCPFPAQGQGASAGFLVAALNRYRPLDDDYRGVPRAGRGPDRGGRRERARLRGRAPARRGAGRARPRQDRVLHQRQPRAAHAADAAARPGRGRARRRRRAARRAAPPARRGHPPQRAAAAQARQHAAGLLAPGVRAGQRALRAGRPRALHGRAGEHVRVGGRARRADARDRLPAAARAGLRRPRDVGQDRPEPALQRAEVHVRGRRDGARRRPRTARAS